MNDADDDMPTEEVEEGAPAWMATFADLMSLLMCFFVLLLSFSEMDLEKYKQVAGSMKLAFGVQKQVKAEEIPKADSVVMKEFSPGRPEPTVIRSVLQQTVDDSRPVPRMQSAMPTAAVEAEVEALATRLREALDLEVETGTVELVAEDYGVKLRIRDEDAFPSGSAALQPAFVPVLDKLVGVLNDGAGHVIVSGHTDDVPIRTEVYPSNWVLSSARAASVVHHLAQARLEDPTRIEIRAYAETRPLMPNDSRAHRASNRRVEIDIGVAASGGGWPVIPVRVALRHDCPRLSVSDTRAAPCRSAPRWSRSARTCRIWCLVDARDALVRRGCRPRAQRPQPPAA